MEICIGSLALIECQPCTGCHGLVYLQATSSVIERDDNQDKLPNADSDSQYYVFAFSPVQFTC